MSDGTSQIDVAARPLRYDSDMPGRRITRAVPVETPINLVFGGIPYAVMMASPGDLIDFAYGFCLTEGIVNTIDDIRAVRIDHKPRGIVLDIDLSSDALHRHLAHGRTRALPGRTGCGICGVEDLEGLPGVAPRSIEAQAIEASAIGAALTRLEHAQPLNEATRAVHAAALFDPSGEIIAVREDVGRHNALDKLVGAIARSRFDAGSGFIVITSRCSFEMVEKAAAIGAGTLVAMSAPTDLAIDRARAYGMTLIAIARQDGALVFVEATAKDHEAAA
jgi:FdhD protein